MMDRLKLQNANRQPMSFSWICLLKSYSKGFRHILSLSVRRQCALGTDMPVIGRNNIGRHAALSARNDRHYSWAAFRDGDNYRCRSTMCDEAAYRLCQRSFHETDWLQRSLSPWSFTKAILVDPRGQTSSHSCAERVRSQPTRIGCSMRVEAKPVKTCNGEQHNFAFRCITPSIADHDFG